MEGKATGESVVSSESEAGGQEQAKSSPQGGDPGSNRPAAVSGFALWFGALGALIAWTIHFALAYPLVELVCQTGWGFLLEVISAVTFVAAVAAGVVSWRNWHAFDEAEREDLLGRGSRPAFMALLGIFAAVIFIVGIILGTIPILIGVDPCAN